MNKSKSIMKRLEKKLRKRKTSKYVLHLYVAGLTSRSQKAIENIRKLCNDHLPGRYELAIQDIYQNPIIIANNEQILAAPTLIKELPLPLRKFVGDMSNTEKLLVGLDLRSKE